MAIVTFASSRSQAINGIIYTSSVYKVDAEFTGAWGCRKCKTNRNINPKAHSELEALAECQRQINLHHLKHDS